MPQQSGTDALVTTLSALLDRAVMYTVTFVVEAGILPRDADLDTLRESVKVMLGLELNSTPGKYFDFVEGLEKSAHRAAGKNYPRTVCQWR